MVILKKHLDSICLKKFISLILAKTARNSPKMGASQAFFKNYIFLEKNYH